MTIPPSANNQATLLCRISSEKQAEGYSLDFQERGGRKYAERCALQITKVVKVIESASKDGRRQWEEYLEQARHGPEAHVLIPKVDRSLRNPHDLALMVDFPKRYGKVLHFFDDGIIYHKDSPASEVLRLMIQGAVATWYSVDLAQKTKRGLDEKAAQGEWPERAPYGYLNDKAHKRIVVDAERVHWVRRIKELSSVGLYSLDKIRDILLSEGYPQQRHRLHRNLIERIIRNPIYAGRYEWPKGSGTLVKGIHEPIVSWEAHEAAVRGLERFNRPRYRKWDFPFSGLIRCGLCPEQRAIVFEIKKKRFIYGHCTGLQDGRRYCPDSQYVRQEVLEDQFVQGLRSVKISTEVGDCILSELAKDSGEEAAAKEAQRALIRQEIGRLNTRIEQAYADKLDGKISEEFWVQKNRAWQAERVRLEETLRRLDESGPSLYIPSVRSLLELSKRIDQLYFSATQSERRELLESVYSNPLLKGKSLEYAYKKPFDLLAEGLRSANWLPELDAIRTEAWRDLRAWLKSPDSAFAPAIPTASRPS